MRSTVIAAVLSLAFTTVHAESFTCKKPNGNSVEGTIVRQGFGEFLRLYYPHNKVTITGPLTRFEDPKDDLIRYSMVAYDGNLQKNIYLTVGLRGKQKDTVYMQDLEEVWFDQCTMYR